MNNKIIVCDCSFLKARCLQRGYSIEEVMPCVISQHGEMWTIDTGHEKYPKVKPSRPVGDELKKILRKTGITSVEACNCGKRAKYMNVMEQKYPGWCEKNIDKIVSWLKEEAERRKMPFIPSIARALIKRAIKNVERNIQCKKKT